jgi:hypothetical protein
LPRIQGPRRVTPDTVAPPGTGEWRVQGLAVAGSREVVAQRLCRLRVESHGELVAALLHEAQHVEARVLVEVPNA